MTQSTVRRLHDAAMRCVDRALDSKRKRRAPDEWRKHMMGALASETRAARRAIELNTSRVTKVVLLESAQNMLRDVLLSLQEPDDPTPPPENPYP